MATPEDADARMTVGELRRVLAARGAPWTVDEDLPDAAPIPTHPSGVSSNSFRVLRAAAKVVGVRGLDFAALLRARPPTNAFLVQQAVALGFLDGDEARRYGEGVPPEGPLSPDQPSETEPPGPSSGA